MGRPVRGDRYLWAALASALAVLGLAACSSGYQPPAAVAAAARGVPEKVDYAWDVRPILSNNCFSCHGNDVGKRKAGLRLDIAANAYAPVPEDRRRRAVVPGHPEKSELIRRLLTADDELKMPPKASHKTLSPAEIAVLTRWIEQGAKYKPHWAYVAPRRVSVGRTPFDGQAVNDLDRYVYAKLQEKGLRPSPEADRETLINRVTLDLTGLPPTLAEVDAFVTDKRPDAYERLVDRLLASPRYGERMAAAWMDVARYSETDGYLDDHHDRFFSPYRDWVISAFNRDLPYDQFVTWQLAGDLIPNHTREQVLATAFARLGKKSTENGLIDEEYRVEYRNERSELVGKAFLGLTVQCARCHDHKYDVISQKDYYALAGLFNSVDERGQYAAGWSNRQQGPTLAWPTPQQSAQLAAANRQIAQRQADYDAVRARAAREAVARADALARSGSGAQFVKTALDAATVAYYPLDGEYAGSVEAFKRIAKFPRPDPQDAVADPEGANQPLPPPGLQPAGPQSTPSKGARLQRVSLAGPAAKTAKPAASPLLAPRVPNGVVESDLRLTASGKPGAAPAALERARFVPGVKGRAFLVDSNRGFLPPKVGWFDRSQAFGFDLWLKPRTGKVYDDAVVIFHQDHTISTGDAGYTLHLEKNRLRFDLVHMSPFNELSVATLDAVPMGRWTHVTVTYDGSSRASGARIYVNGQPARTEVLKDNLTRTILPTMYVGVLGGDFYGFAFGTKFRAEEFTGGAIDEVRVFDRALTPIEAAYLHDPASRPADPGAAKQALVELLVATDPRVVKAGQALAQAREAENQVASNVKQVMVLADAPRIRPTYRLDHGQYDQPREEVQPAGLGQVFRWSPRKYPANRLGLARWLFDPKNPLTARVYVNRLWQSHFGTGIVETVDDFGAQGSNPSNPELLDYLAVEFQRSHWDIKHLQKLIVMSATYRQVSNVSPELATKDPRNLYLARGPRFRLPAEMIRDSVLFASGLLDGRIGGGSVYPYQPPGVWESAISMYRYPDADKVPAWEHHRRTLYTFIKRNAQPPSLAVFDMADRNVSTVIRRVSSTPLQALNLLNDPQYVEAYRVLSEHLLQGGGDPNRQLVTLFRLATRRQPRPAELATLVDYRDAQIARYAKSPDAAKALVSIGVTPADPKLDPARLAALTMTTAVVFNTPDAYWMR